MMDNLNDYFDSMGNFLNTRDEYFSSRKVKQFFEIRCLGCGQTLYNLPFKPHTHYTMTCQHCGEVTIVHIDRNSGIHSATVRQRDLAYKATKERLFSYLKKVYVTSRYSYDDSFNDERKIEETIKFDWIEHDDFIMHQDDICKIIFSLKIVGLKLIIEQTLYIYEHIDYWRESALKSLVSEIKVSKFEGLLKIDDLNKQMKNKLKNNNNE